MNGGDLDRDALKESFSRIKYDIEKLNMELLTLKEKQNQKIDKELIVHIVKETLKNLNHRNSFMHRINKNRKSIILNRIKTLASQKNLSLSDLKDIVVDQEILCSKATFYRYIDKMKKRGLIDYLSIDDMVIVTNI